MDFDGLREAKGLGRAGEHKLRRSITARSAVKQGAKYPYGAQVRPDIILPRGVREPSMYWGIFS
jgi:hypothetical protein